ncbi:hypothetical protein BJ170DRAFT_644459 [Xylariales sp. AK1849]|nr:hypothetical protein BJ170DRAFT_644459 [Xylariales sp. AK1849]
MLRSARPLWTGSTRAFAFQKATAASSRQLSRQASQFTAGSSPSYSSRISRAPVAPQVAPLVHKTRYATKPLGNLQSKANHEEEKKFGERKLEAHPESVTSESSVRHVVEPDVQPTAKPVGDGIAHDLGLVKETFDLAVVPKESYFLGLAGTIPYLATSVSNVYLSWVLNTEWPTTSTFLNNILMSHDSARYWLGVVEPIQLGYGAVIISFLGAIHWGLEYAEKQPLRERTRFRYGVGLLAPVIAWPTLLMPWQFAMTTQFAAFVGLYFADSRAAVRGWAPHWYGTYRFVLTAIVGVAIMISLIGRAKIGDAAPRLSGLDEQLRQTHGEEPYNAKWAEAEEPERKRQKKAAEEAEKKKQEEEKKKKEEEEQKKKQEEAEKKTKEADKKKDGEKKGGEKKGGAKKDAKKESKDGEDGGDKNEDNDEAKEEKKE